MHVAMDIDQTIYSCGFAAEGEDISHALGNVKRKIQEIIQNTNADTWSIHMGGEDNFRKDVAITQVYKGNRTASRPANYDQIRQYLKDVWNAEESNGMEADDTVSILLWEDFVKCGGDREVATLALSSPDKDLNNTPGWHYNPQKDTLTWITLEQANRHFWYQMLMGDSTDNIKGLPYCTPEVVNEYSLSRAALKGCGKASAKKIMEATADTADAKKAVIRAYISWGLDNGMSDLQISEYMTEQGQLLWMIRELNEFGEPVMFNIEESEIERQRQEDTEAGDRGYGFTGEEGADRRGAGSDSYRVGGGWRLHRGDSEAGRITPIVEPTSAPSSDPIGDGEAGGVG